jgi:hypothetical protein
MTDDRIIDVNLSSITETEHPGARDAILRELVDAGWQSCDNRHEDRRTFCRENGPDFDDALNHAQHIVGKRLVVER